MTFVGRGRNLHFRKRLPKLFSVVGTTRRDGSEPFTPEGTALSKHVLFCAAAIGLLLSFSALTSPLPAFQQDDDTSSAAFAGRVIHEESGEPLSNARVTLELGGRRTTTDGQGRFLLREARPGIDVVTVSLVGYAEMSLPVDLARGSTTTVTLHLAPEAVRMDEITVTVKPGWQLEEAGFYERRNRGLGVYFGPELIERRQPNRATDLLRNLSGIYVASPRHGSSEVRMRRAAGNRDCPPRLYVNGHLARGQTLDDIHSSDLLALEVYKGPGQTPAQFKRGSVGYSDCGAIVAWTRLYDNPSGD